MTSTARFLSVCCLGVLVGFGALSACNKTVDSVAALTSEGSNATLPPSVDNPQDGGTAAYEKERVLAVKLSVCRNYVMGESSKPADLNGAMKLCAEKKAPLPDKDPWGNALVYEPDPAGGNQFKLYSPGPDGKPNTDDDRLPTPDKR